MLVSDLEDSSASAYSELRAAVVAYARRLTDPATAEDVAQEVFLRLLKYKRGSVRAIPRAFVFAMARNVAITIRAASRRCTAGQARETAPSASRRIDPDLDTLLRAMKRLSPIQREALSLTVLRGLSEEEAARAMRVSRSAVGARRRDALARLRELAGGAAAEERRAEPGPVRVARTYARVA